MAIYHFRVQVLSRSDNRSAVFAAAYRAGVKLFDERLGQEKDYTNKRRPLYKTILAPDCAPSWVKERSLLWNAVEAAETRKDAQVARELEFSLPAELSLPRLIELVKGYVTQEFVKLGMIADVAINKPKRGRNKLNVYAQVLLTTRYITSAGFGAKNRDWNSKQLLKKWREQWAVHANKALEAAGHKERIDHRSMEEQGIEREPTVPRELPPLPKKKTKTHVIVPVPQQHEFLVRAYVVWLKSHEPQKLQQYEELLKSLCESRPRNNWHQYVVWREKILEVQHEVFKLVEHPEPPSSNPNSTEISLEGNANELVVVVDF